MTAPELVEVVAGVIRGHPLDWQFDGRRSRLECDCGAEVIAGDGAVHQARAVLDALAEAGTVEWGTVGDREGSVIYEWSSEESARYYAERHDGSRVVSRLTFPWTAE